MTSDCHLSTAAEKMRRQQLVSNAVEVFINTNLFKDNQYSNSATLKITPTDSTRELIAQAMRILNAIYRPGYGYRKSGVVLLGLQPRQAETKRLFNEESYVRDRELMSKIDLLNVKHGRQTVRFGPPIKSDVKWKMSRSHLSPSYTTNIDQILRVNS